MHILVIDVGTSSLRSMVFTHTGQELFCKQIPYRPLYLENGWVEQPPRRLGKRPLHRPVRLRPGGESRFLAP